MPKSTMVARPKSRPRVLDPVPEPRAMTMMPPMMTTMPSNCHLLSFSRRTNQAPRATIMALVELMATMGPLASGSLASPSLRVSMAADSVTPAATAIQTNRRDGQSLVAPARRFEDRGGAEPNHPHGDPENEGCGDRGFRVAVAPFVDGAQQRVGDAVA